MPKKLRKVEASLDDEIIKLTHENDFIRLWKGFRWMTISKTKSVLENASDIYNRFNRTYHLNAIFGKKVIMKFLQAVVEEGKEYERLATIRKTKPSIFTTDEWGGWGKQRSTSGKDIAQIYLKDKDKIVEDLEKYKASTEKYAQLGVAHKRGYLLHGKPGNGKSSLIYAIAKYLKYDIYSFDLSNMSSNNFSKAMRNIPDYSVIVFEDFDSFFKGREPQGELKITFSTILNSLSGVADKDNCIFIITTNHGETLDPALIRPGRCDMQFEIQNPTKEIQEEFLSEVYDTPVKLEKFVDLSFSKLQGLAIANIEDLDTCLQQLYNYTEDVTEQEYTYTLIKN